MADQFSVAGAFKIAGFEDLKARLEWLPPLVQKGAMRKGMRKASKKVKDMAKRNVPVRTGHLKRMLAEWPRKKQPKDGYVVLVGVRRISRKKRAAMEAKGKAIPKGAAYAVPLEYGSRKAPAQPFLRPSLAVAGPPAFAEMAPDIAKEAQRLLDKGRT